MVVSSCLLFGEIKFHNLVRIPSFATVVEVVVVVVVDSSRFLFFLDGFGFGGGDDGGGGGVKGRICLKHSTSAA